MNKKEILGFLRVSTSRIYLLSRIHCLCFLRNLRCVRVLKLNCIKKTSIYLNAVEIRLFLLERRLFFLLWCHAEQDVFISATSSLLSSTPMPTWHLRSTLTERLCAKWGPAASLGRTHAYTFTIKIHGCVDFYLELLISRNTSQLLQISFSLFVTNKLNY